MGALEVNESGYDHCVVGNAAGTVGCLLSEIQVYRGFYTIIGKTPVLQTTASLSSFWSFDSKALTTGDCSSFTLHDAGICSGKQTVANFLITRHGFRELQYQEAPASREYRTSATADVAGAPRTFSNVDDFLDFVTREWRENWIIVDIRQEALLAHLSRRPFFLLVSLDAPVTLRWARHQKRWAQLPESKRRGCMTFEEFVLQSDDRLYHPLSGLAKLIAHAEVRMINSSASIEQLHDALDKLDLTDEKRLRPNWDQYFMELASLAAQRSNCMKRRVGCVLVRDSRVISTGYNGTPRNLKNCNEGGCERCNQGQHAGVALSTCLCIHAEENALLEAGRERIRDGAILYCNTCPCLTCSIKITQVGISEVVYCQGYSMDTEAAAIFLQSGVKLRQFSSPPKGLVHLEPLNTQHGGTLVAP